MLGFRAKLRQEGEGNAATFSSKERLFTQTFGQGWWGVVVTQGLREEDGVFKASQLPRELEASLGYMGLCLKNLNK